MRLHVHRVLAVVLLSLVFLLPTLSGAAQKAHQGAPKPEPAQPPTPTVAPLANGQPTPAPPPASQFGSTLASVLNSDTELGDYIPCEFTIEQLRNLRPSPAADYLTSYEAEELKKGVIAAALSQASSGNFAEGNGNSFSEEIGNASFDGRTRSQALAEVIFILQKHQKNALQTAAVQELQKHQINVLQTATTGQVSDLLSEYQKRLNAVSPDNLSSADFAQKLLEANDKFLSDVDQNIENLSTKRANDQQEAAKKQQTADEARKAADKAQEEASNYAQKPNKVSTQFAMLQQNVDSAAQAANSAALEAKAAQDTALKTAQDLQDQQKSYPEVVAMVQDAKNTVQQGTQNQNKSGQSIVDSARSTINALTRPPDVGCAMSVLSWREVQNAFGRLLANEYIGVQVVVRNLNESKQFLIHDGELAVDADLNGRTGRFYSGRDQKIVRQLSLAQQSYHYRNLIVNVVGAIGTLASAAMPFAGPSFKDATGVYNSGFVTGLTKTWPDRSIDQLNLLNDVGFSASTDSKAILVPKSGAVMFVIFIPSKQFEQGWWAQRCVEDIVSAPPPKDSSTQQYQFGIDLDKAYTACQNVRPFKLVHYHFWSPTADAIFRELAFAVVAGTHIAEESKTTPAIAKIDCPRDSLGNVDFSQQVSGSITCSLTGTNLDKVAKLKLRNAADATDNATADGSVTVSGDTTTAKVDFPLAQIGPLQKPDYKVYGVTKDGAEDDAKQTLHFALTPFFVGVQPETTIDLSAGKSTVTIKLAGYHLDKLGKQDKIRLSATSLSKQGDFPIGDPTVSAASFDVKPGSDPLTENTKLELFRVPSDSANSPNDLKLSVTVSGTFPVSLPPAAPATGSGVPPPKQKKSATGNKPKPNP